MFTLLDGKKTGEAMKARIADEAAELVKKGIVPTLAVVLVGEDPASQVYVRNKKNACIRCGIESEVYTLPADTTEEKLMTLLDELNERKEINGILVQLPLPAHLSPDRVIARIRPDKDVDAFHPENVGAIMLGDYHFVPCTPAGILALLDAYEIPVKGKHCVVIGRSNIVGKPMAMLLLHRHGTVTICHSRTLDLPSVTRQADILVSAVGKAGFVTRDMVKEGAVVIDVGMNRNAEGKLCGDVAFDEVSPLASYITPVPGGVGVMTVTMLMRNTITAARLQNGLEI